MRRILNFTIFCLALCILGSGFVAHADEPLNPAARDFLFDEIDLTQKNGAYLLEGFVAPANVDAYETGKKVAREKIKDWEASLTREEEKEYFDPKTRIDFKGEIKAFSCVFDKGLRKACDVEAQILRHVKANEILLERYAQLQKFERVESDIRFAAAPSSSLIDTHRLNLARIIVRAKQGDAEGVMSEWIANTQFWQHVMEQRKSMVEHAIYMIMLQQNMQALTVLLNESPSLAHFHQSQIQEILDRPAFGKNGRDWESTLKGEYQALKILYNPQNIDLKQVAILQPNCATNAYYAYSMDMLRVARAPLEYFNRYYQPFARKHLQDNFVTCGTVSALLLGGIKKGSPLLESGYKQYVHAQALKVFAAAKARRVSASNMQGFIKEDAANIVSPWVLQHLKWHQDKQVLEVTLEDYEREIYYKAE